MLTIQSDIESAIQKLIEEFLSMPYKYFTEADAVARFHCLSEGFPSLGRKVHSLDGYEIGLVHREFPTFFRFDDKNPVARLDNPEARRGHYDTIILNPEFITAHHAETVANRNIRLARDEAITPFQAIVEFKLYARGWSDNRARGIRAELGKLHLSGAETQLCYLVVLMRNAAPASRGWSRYWPTVERDLAEAAMIRSVLAVKRLAAGKETELFHFGQWLSQA